MGIDHVRKITQILCVTLGELQPRIEEFVLPANPMPVIRECNTGFPPVDVDN